MRHHRLDDIGHGEHLGPRKDLVAYKPTRVAGAVATLVMLIDQFVDRFFQVRGDGDLVSRLSVAFDEIELDRRDQTWFAEDLGRTAALPMS